MAAAGLIKNQLDIAVPGTSGQAAETGSIESRRGLGPVGSTVGVARYLSVRTADDGSTWQLEATRRRAGEPGHGGRLLDCVGRSRGRQQGA
jgi:hypothetical protein